MAIHLGTQGWSYKDWIGSFYPNGATSKEFLSFYARSFNAVELDTTFYGIPSPDRVARWNEATPSEFQFTAKVPRSITHDRHLVDSREELLEFVQALQPLGSKLGAVLIQLPPDFSIEERDQLERFLAQLPSDIRFAAEFRHRSWLEESTFELLRRHDVAWTAIDLSYMPKRVEITADFAYVRWLGNRKQIVKMNEVQIDRHAELDAWADRLEEVASRVERIYGFANNHYSGHSPADIRYLQKRLGMPAPEPPPVQRTLL